MWTKTVPFFARRQTLAVADAELKQLKQCLKEEQERSAAAWKAASSNRSAPIADLRVIFDEGHRLVEAKLKLKVGIPSNRPINFALSTSCVIHACSGASAPTPPCGGVHSRARFGVVCDRIEYTLPFQPTTLLCSVVRTDRKLRRWSFLPARSEGKRVRELFNDCAVASQKHIWYVCFSCGPPQGKHTLVLRHFSTHPHRHNRFNKRFPRCSRICRKRRGCETWGGRRLRFR